MADAREPVYYSDGIDPVHRSSPDELFLVTIEVRPESGSAEAEEAGGAVVNCWIDADELRAAERRAIAGIQEQGWRPHRFEEWELVTRSTYADRSPQDGGGPDLREVVDQAFLDGEVFVFHTWPADAPDSPDEYRLTSRCT